MNASNISRLILQWRLSLIHIGWIKLVIALMFLLAALGWFWGMPHLRSQLSKQQAEVRRAQKMLAITPTSVPAVAPPQAEVRLRAFYQSLGEKRYAEQQVKTLFAVAEKNNLSLRQAEYKSAYDKNGKFGTYRIQLPVKGSYLAIRHFCENVLEVIPFASLDELNFKREAIANPVLEAKLSFTLYLRVDGGDTSHQTQKFAQGFD